MEVAGIQAQPRAGYVWSVASLLQKPTQRLTITPRIVYIVVPGVFYYRNGDLLGREGGDQCVRAAARDDSVLRGDDGQHWRGNFASTVGDFTAVFEQQRHREDREQLPGHIQRAAERNY